MARKISTRIMRVSLEELMGNHQPPKLTERVMKSLAESPEKNDPRTQRLVESAFDDETLGQLGVTPHHLSHPQTARHRDLRRWTGMIVALSVVVFAVLSVMVLIAIRESLQPPQIAVPSRDLSNPAPLNITAQPWLSPESSQKPSNITDNLEPQLSQHSSSGSDPANPSDLVTEPSQERSRPTPQTPWRDRDVPDTQFVVTQVNQQLTERWRVSGVEPATRVSDLAWADRTFKLLLGRSMTPAEQANLDSRLPLSRSRVASELLYGNQYYGEFNRHWSERLGNFLLSSTQSRNETLISPDAFKGYLQQQLDQQVGLDDIVVALVTATGKVTPKHPEFNPATNFLVSTNDEKGIGVTESTLRLFWGERATCSRCHDPKTSAGLSQTDFWRINAHYRQLSIQGNQESGVELSNRDFVGELQDPSQAAVFYEDDSKSLIAAFPKFTEGEQAPKSGRVEEFDRRSAVAYALVQDIRFPRTMVNWVWSEAFGFPLTSGAASSDPQSKAAHQLLDQLALDFASHDFQLATLLHWIALSEPMSLDSVPNSDFVADAPWLGQPALFSYFYDHEPRFPSVKTGLAAMEKAFNQGPQAVLALRGDSLETAPLANVSEGSAQADAAPKAGMNWRHVRNNWLTSDEMAKELQRIVVSPLTEEQKIEHVFVLAVGRAPTKAQVHMVRKWLDQEPSNPISVYQDLWWTLSNSQR
jgi:hypothetical protein